MLEKVVQENADLRVEIRHEREERQALESKLATLEQELRSGPKNLDQQLRWT